MPIGGSVVYGTFIDLSDDAKPWLQVPAADDTRDAQISLISEMACQWVQRYIGRPVAPQRYDRRFDGWSGWGGANLELPYSPVLEIISVTEYWGVSGPHVLTESTPTVQVDGWQCEYAEGRLIRVFPGNVQKPWFPGSRNVEVVWIAGFDPIPAEIKVATLELIAHWFRNTQQASRSVKAGSDYSPADDKGLWQGVPYRITNLLTPFLQVGIA